MRALDKLYEGLGGEFVERKTYVTAQRIQMRRAVLCVIISCYNRIVKKGTYEERIMEKHPSTSRV